MKNKIVKLIDGIQHQDIGGKKFIIFEELNVSDILDTPFTKMTIAMFNFIMRRKDFFDMPENKIIYYGHVIDTNYGYYIAEDEIDA